jgi:hypothetical protein
MNPSFQIAEAKRDLSLVDSWVVRNKALKVPSDISLSVVSVRPNSRTVPKVFFRSTKGYKALIKVAATEEIYYVKLKRRWIVIFINSTL